MSERFDNLKVFVGARQITNTIYEITKKQGFVRDYVLVRQIAKSAISIMSNIAEGYERQTHKEFKQFLYIAKGSCGEARAQLMIAFDRRYISQDKYDEITDRLLKISSMLSNFIKKLNQRVSL